MIHIETSIESPVEKVWKAYNNPEDIQQWNQASPEWHCPKSVNDLRVGGRFIHTMAAKDASFQFDFSGTYTEVIPEEKIAYTMDDGRKAIVEFIHDRGFTKMKIDFDPENENSLELQKDGWFAILTSFKDYVENKK